MGHGTSSSYDYDEFRASGGEQFIKDWIARQRLMNRQWANRSTHITTELPPSFFIPPGSDSNQWHAPSPFKQDVKYNETMTPGAIHEVLDDPWELPDPPLYDVGEPESPIFHPVNQEKPVSNPTNVPKEHQDDSSKKADPRPGDEGTHDLDLGPVPPKLPKESQLLKKLSNMNLKEFFSYLLLSLGVLLVGFFLLIRILETLRTLDSWWISLSSPGGRIKCPFRNTTPQISEHYQGYCPWRCRGYLWMCLRLFIIFLFILLAVCGLLYLMDNLSTVFNAFQDYHSWWWTKGCLYVTYQL